MRIKLPYKCILPVFMVFLSVSMTAQAHRLPQPKMSETSEGSGGPPPPGLVVPIDERSYLLLVTGLGLGIYLLRIRKTV